MHPKVIKGIIPTVVCAIIIILFFQSFQGNDLGKEGSKFNKVINNNNIQIHNSKGKSDSWKDEQYCNVNCTVGVPCEYPDEVDFRIIVMTYNRAHSVNRSLNALLNLETLNDKISVEVWIDRSKDGKIDEQTLKVAEDFVNRFRASKGRACVHKQNKNAYISGQWVFTWRPKKDSNELGLILEDDVIVSPLAYKWVKGLHKKYGQETNIAGYTLQMENVRFFSTVHNRGAMRGPPKHQVFLYPVLGTWGYVAHPRSWRNYQDWYMKMRPDRDIKTDKIKPFVPGIVPTSWYHSFIKRGTQESMWEMWHIKFTHEHKLFTVYSNLLLYTQRGDVLLSNNRQEKGLHFGGGGINDQASKLLKKWDKSFEKLPDFKEIAHYNYNGSPCTETCCFDTSCLKKKKKRR